MARGGSSLPTGRWNNWVEFPNTVSKIKSMVEHAETPPIERFRGKPEDLPAAARCLIGTDFSTHTHSADLALLFDPLPRVPILLMF